MRHFILVLALFGSLNLVAQNNQGESSDITVVATYPLYRGCKESLSYADQEKCTTRKINNFFKMSFDYELADRLFPQQKMTKVLVTFVINKRGKIERVGAKAHKREMAVEAIKVMKRLPRLKRAGYQLGKPVDTPFSLELTVYF
jgi:hypothetical protein